MLLLSTTLRGENANVDPSGPMGRYCCLPSFCGSQMQVVEAELTAGAGARRVGCGLAINFDKSKAVWGRVGRSRGGVIVKGVRYVGPQVRMILIDGGAM